MTRHASSYPASSQPMSLSPHSGRRKNRAGQQKKKRKEENLYIFFYFRFSLLLPRFGLCAHLAVFMKNYHVFFALIRHPLGPGNTPPISDAFTWPQHLPRYTICVYIYIAFVSSFLRSWCLAISVFDFFASGT